MKMSKILPCAGILCTLFGCQFVTQPPESIDNIFGDKGIEDFIKDRPGSSAKSSASVAPVEIQSSSSQVVEPQSSSSQVERQEFLWIGNEGDKRVETGFDNGSNTSGYWKVFNDAVDGGKSVISWPEQTKGIVDGVVDVSVIEECGGVCGSFKLDVGRMDYNPFVSLYFDVAGLDESGKAVAADVSGWDGVCVEYSASKASVLELVPDDAMNKMLLFTNTTIFLKLSYVFSHAVKSATSVPFTSLCLKYTLSLPINNPANSFTEV